MKKRILLCLLTILVFKGNSFSQTCTTPITVATNGSWTNLDSFNIATRYLKFHATGENYRIKILVSNLDTLEHSLDITENSCTSPFSFSPYLNISSDTIIVDQFDLTNGNDYLIILNNGSHPTFMKYKASIVSVPSSSIALQTCQSGDCSYEDLCGELVCNGGFECYYGPINTLSSIYNSQVVNWGSATDGTPDLLTAGATNNLYKVPCNRFGLQSGHNNSQSYAGISSRAEVIQTKLRSALQQNKSYIISLYVSRADNTACEVQNLSIFTSTSQIYQPGYSTLTLTPLATITNTSLLNNGTGWERISICYTPTNSGVQFIAIGGASNAGCISSTFSVVLCSGYPNNISPQNYPYSYLYIDDVSVKAVEDIIDNNNALSVCSNTPTGLNALSCPPGNDLYTVTWSPATGLSSSVSANPVITLTASQVYTIVMNYTPVIGNSCSASGTSSIQVNNGCCTTTVTPVSTGVIPTGISHYTSSRYFVSDMIVPPGGQLILDDNEYLFSNDVKLTVSINATLTIIGSHLYSCGSGTWKGIVTNDGSYVEAYKAPTGNRQENLIEDAAIAIDATRQIPGSNNITKLDLTEVTFNKNHTAIKITDYTQNSTNYPFTIRNCVFTCRNFQASITPSSWPGTINLRSATNPTTDLTSPYSLGNATVTTVKNANILIPTVSSTVGIHLVNVGYTSNAGLNSIFKGITIGDGTDYTKFNLFDNMGTGIYATNSNLYSYNNAFQNSNATGQGYTRTGSSAKITAAIYSEANPNFGTNAYFNTLLDLNPNGNTDKSLGNRFWNCHTAVQTVNNFSLNASYATFRSTHTLSTNGFMVGAWGISALTNRVAGYTVRYCDFNNIAHPCGVDFKPGVYYITTNTLSGIYAGNMNIRDNYIGATLNNTTSITSEFMITGVSLYAPISGPIWNVVSGSSFKISYNTINQSFQGVVLSGIKHKTTNVFNNSIDLIDVSQISPGNSTWQPGIFIANTTSVSAYSNTLSSSTNTNLAVSLVHAGFSNSSYINCNYLTNGYRGFLFEGPNNGMKWKGNTMQSHKRGMSLYGAGVIGPQGSVGNPIDNQWLGTWSGTLYCTYVDVGSTSLISPLTTRTGTWIPATNSGDGFVSPSVWYSNPIGSLATTTTGAYSCGSSTINTPAIRPNQGDYDTDEMFYIAEMSLYNYLREDPDLIDPGSDLEDFYDEMTGTSIETFAEIEEEFYSNEVTTAESLNSAVSPTNSVETNYKLFYSLYGSFMDEAFDSSDSTELYDLAHLCPSTDGACVYKARVLYDLLYYNLEDYSNMCGTDGLKTIGSRGTTNITGNWDVLIYPNPSSSTIVLQSIGKNFIQNLEVSDVSGRIILEKNLVNSISMTKLELSVPSGIYFIKIRNSKNEVLTKKILIQK